MTLGRAATLAFLFLGSATLALAQSAPAPQRTQVEIYRIVPGQHEAFLRHLALADEALKSVGLPPRQLFVHQDGADWDFLLLQPADRQLTPTQSAGLAAARKRLGLPAGAAFFIEYRKFIAEHTDTVTEGPTTAADWLAKLDASRR
jgi:hypothetical protein